MTLQPVIKFPFQLPLNVQIYPKFKQTLFKPQNYLYLSKLI